MQSRITGTTMPVLEFVLEPNESVISEAGELSWMGSSIQMTTHTQFAGGGGLFGVLKRVAGGGSLFMTEYRAIGAAGEVAFATKLPGHIVPVEVSPGHEYMIHRHGFLCATSGIQISVGSSSRSAPASSAAAASCSNTSADKAPHGSSSPGNSLCAIYNRAKICAFIPAMWAHFNPACLSRSRLFPESRT
jgi:uncharacterized protein (AIM24 family)